VEKLNRRYFGKIKVVKVKNGDPFYKIIIEDLYPKRKDGSINKYYKGQLLWFDNKTKKYYQVKSCGVGGVKENDNDYINSLFLDLDNDYHVNKLQNSDEDSEEDIEEDSEEIPF